MLLAVTTTPGSTGPIEAFVLATIGFGWLIFRWLRARRRMPEGQPLLRALGGRLRLFECCCVMTLSLALLLFAVAKAIL
jgi:hypothetical protein